MRKLSQRDIERVGGAGFWENVALAGSAGFTTGTFVGGNPVATGVALITGATFHEHLQEAVEPFIDEQTIIGTFF